MSVFDSLEPADKPFRNTSKRMSAHRLSKSDLQGEKPLDAKKTDEKEKEIDLQGVPMSYYEEMKEIFKIFDADGSGAIDPKEIREQMISLGFTVDNTTIYQLISDLDSDGSQKLEFDEFFGMLRDTLEIHKPGFNCRQTFDEIFDFLDDLDPKNRDGKIDQGNLRRLANVLGDNIADSELALMVKRADPDGKGYVLPDDFYQLMVDSTKRMDQGDLPKPEPKPEPRRRSFTATGDEEVKKQVRKASRGKLFRSFTNDSLGQWAREKKDDGDLDDSNISPKLRRKSRKDRLSMMKEKFSSQSSGDGKDIIGRSQTMDGTGSSTSSATEEEPLSPLLSEQKRQPLSQKKGRLGTFSEDDLDLVPEEGGMGGLD